MNILLSDISQGIILHVPAVRDILGLWMEEMAFIYGESSKYIE
jgi:hypothetical protein